MAAEMGISVGSAWQYLHKGLDMLDSLHSRYIRWPSPRECAEIAQQFQSYAGLPGIVGAADCSHIAVRVRKREQDDYTNRKSFYSVHFFAVVDAADRFLFVSCGSSGATTDSTVIRFCELTRAQFMALCERTLPPIPYGYYLIADGGFMALPWVISNYRAAQCRSSSNCGQFNNLVAATRHGIERAYGQVKGRFKILGGRSSFNSIDTVVKMNYAAVVLHNANLDVESRYAALVRGPIGAGSGEPLDCVVRAHREYARIVAEEHDDDPMSPSDWPVALTRQAGMAVRRGLVQHVLGVKDDPHI